MKRLLVSSLIFCFFSAPLLATDWLYWRGNNGNGIHNETAWNPRAIENPSNVKWTVNVGMGHSAVAVQGHRLYTMGNHCYMEKSDTTFVDVVTCLDINSGKTLWEYPYPCVEGEDPGPGSTPVLDDNRLYSLSRHGDLYCFNAENGSVLWMRHLVDDSTVYKKGWGFSPSPVIAGDKLYININLSGIAFDKTNGRLLWSTPRENCGYATTVLLNSQTAIFNAMDRVYALSLDNGDTLWTYPFETGCTDPIALGEKLLVCGRGQALLDLSSGRPDCLWHQPSTGSGFQNWVMMNGHAFGIGRGGRHRGLICVDMADGQVKWSKNIGREGALIGSNGKLIVINQRGKLLIIDANGNAYNELASAEPIPMADNTGVHNRRQCHCWTNPVLANGHIYLRNTYGDLVCVDVSR